ncbi:MAG: hypothetical protein R2731_03305 [Nocardioides sp.]
MTWTDVAVGLAILVGLAGIVVPVLPGTVLILAALLAWALELGTPPDGSSSRSEPPCWSSARW